jgi:hypothetical protein
MSSIVVRKEEDTEIEKPKFKVIDTTPKHLQHMTAEDLLDPDPEIKKAEMLELIKEARSKIRPVVKAMSDEELRSLIKTVEEVQGDK